MITAHHCIPSKSSIKRDHDRVVSAVLEMGYIDEEPTARFPVSIRPDFFDATLDFSIVRVQDIPSERFGVTQPIADDILIDEALMILHHPDKFPKRATVKDCASVNSTAASRGQIRHNCDTAMGSSGGAIFRMETGEFVGIHTHGPELTTETNPNRGVFFCEIETKLGKLSARFIDRSRHFGTLRVARSNRTGGLTGSSRPSERSEVALREVIASR